MKHLGIIGAGIAGLFTAIFLQKKCPELIISIFEQSPDLIPRGGGIVLAGNATRIIEEHGFETGILKNALKLKAFSIYDDKGRQMSHLNFGSVQAKYGIRPSYAIRRGHLQANLLSLLNRIPLQRNKRVVNIEQNDQVNVTFEDESIERFDYLIGADGIHSVIRKCLFGQVRKRYSGYTCWRGIASMSDENMPRFASEIWTNKGRFGMVPLIDHQVYWFACVNSKEPSDPNYRLYGEKQLSQHFESFPAPISEVLASTDWGNVHWDDIYDFKPIKEYARGNTLLIGDAAHAMTPNLGQGACQGIEDAYAISQLLSRTKGWDEAIKQFQDKRVPRCRKMVARSRQIGKLAQLDHLFLSQVRNQLVRMTPQWVGEKSLVKTLQYDL